MRNTTWSSVSDRLKHDPVFVDWIGYVLLSIALLELCVIVSAVVWKWHVTTGPTVAKPLS